jgi:type I protein arginine methyltransferase
MKSPASYALTAYGEMMAPTRRMHAYADALRHAVRPGATVLDIGAGTGIFSLLACRFGAGQVHAVEPDDALLLASSFAADNGCADRITLHQRLSTEVNLPVRADVVVSDLRGILPLFQHHIPAIIDARERLMLPGGVLIPMRDTLYACLVESPEHYARYRVPWLENDFGLDLHAGHPMAVNSWRNTRITPAQVLTPPQAWCTLDYRTIDSPDVRGDVAWTAQRAGVAHGVGLWFDAELVPGVGFSNAPGEPELVYGQAFFPLQSELSLETGDRISIALSARLVGADYVFSWRTTVVGVNGGAKARFEQSTFLGEPLSLARLKRMDARFAPARTEAIDIDQECLAMASGVTKLEDMAQRLTEKFPRRFPKALDALAYVAHLFEHYEPAPAPVSIANTPDELE